jgi:hypothetical protein
MPVPNAFMVLCFVLIIQFRTINTRAEALPLKNGNLHVKVEESGRFCAYLRKDRDAKVEGPGNEMEESGR